MSHTQSERLQTIEMEAPLKIEFQGIKNSTSGGDTDFIEVHVAERVACEPIKFPKPRQADHRGRPC